jgi:predicted protein tyrosine phosphatase
MLNRLANVKNRFQGEAKKVLCVCSAGLLRSPTAAVILSQAPFNYNTRACGTSEEYALIPLDSVLIEWADIIVVMDEGMQRQISSYKNLAGKTIVNLDIEDRYPYMDEELQKLIKERMIQHMRLDNA